MGLKKRNKVSAEFNMSSLTDIIFLLLIFFMLTSSVIVPNALNLKMPGKSSAVTVDSKPDDVTIRRDGSLYLNGKKVSATALERGLRSIAQKSRGKANITISPGQGAPTEAVVIVMDAARRLNMNAILAMEAD